MAVRLLEATPPPCVVDYSAALRECGNIRTSHHLAGDDGQRARLKTAADLLPASKSRPAPRPRFKSLFQKVKRLDGKPRLEFTAEVDFHALTCSSRDARLPWRDVWRQHAGQLKRKCSIDPAFDRILQKSEEEVKSQNPGPSLCFLRLRPVQSYASVTEPPLPPPPPRSRLSSGCSGRRVISASPSLSLAAARSSERRSRVLPLFCPPTCGPLPLSSPLPLPSSPPPSLIIWSLSEVTKSCVSPDLSEQLPRCHLLV